MVMVKIVLSVIGSIKTELSVTVVGDAIYCFVLWISDRVLCFVCAH